MADRSAAAFGVLVLTAAFANAQAVPRPTPDCLDQPTQYPTLLTPPANTGPPLAVVPRGPSGEYDHGLLYLPDYVPPSAPEACRPLGRWWISPSFEFAWMPTSRAPAAVRLRVPTPGGGTIPGPVLPAAGRSSDSFRGGFALTGGLWFDDRNTRGVDASFLTVGGGETTFDGVAPEMLVLFPDGPGSSPQLIVFPPGTPLVGLFPATFSTWFATADVNYRHNLHCGPNARLDLVAGYRFAYLEDELFLGDVPDGSRTDYRHNRAAVSNRFHGGQVGLAGEVRGERWYVAGTAKAALGVVDSCVCASGLFVNAEGETGADGFTRLAALGDPGGSRFAVLPSGNVQVGRFVRDHARVFAGYSFHYLNRTARLGDALDPSATGLALTDFWVQSFSLGFELRY